MRVEGDTLPQSRLSPPPPQANVLRPPPQANIDYVRWEEIGETVSSILLKGIQKLQMTRLFSIPLIITQKWKHTWGLWGGGGEGGSLPWDKVSPPSPLIDFCLYSLRWDMKNCIQHPLEGHSETTNNQDSLYHNIKMKACMRVEGGGGHFTLG